MMTFNAMQIFKNTLKGIFCISLAILITLMAKHFDNPGLLWWYLLPAFVALDI